MSELSTVPAVKEVGSGETLPLRIDVSGYLGVGETPSAPSCTLTDLITNTAYPAGLSGAASVSGNAILQTVTALAAGHRYRLVVTFTAAAGKVMQTEAELLCLF